MIKQKIIDFLKSLKRKTGSYCILCEKYTLGEEGVTICESCLEKLKIFPAVPLPVKLKHIKTAFSLVPYTDSVRRAIRKFKFQNNPGYVKAIGNLSIRQLKEANDMYEPSLFSMIDMVIPVPLSKERLAERGYNQSELIAKHIAEYFGKELNTTALIKHKNNNQQSLTPHKLRQQNVKGVYLANEEASGKRILLIDDILTTGSTADECAKTLLSSGAANVSLFTVTNSRKYFYTNDFYIYLKNGYKNPEN